MKANELQLILFNELIGSTRDQRKEWIDLIIQNELALTDLCGLLVENEKIAMRFTWLLSDVGMENPTLLKSALPDLLPIIKPLHRPELAGSFANYWLIAGIPETQEAAAIDHCFYWIKSPESNNTLKNRAWKVLKKLAEKYPDLENELQLIQHY